MRVSAFEPQLVYGVLAGALCVALHSTHTNAGASGAGRPGRGSECVLLGRAVRAGRASTGRAARPPASGSSGARTLSVVKKGGLLAVWSVPKREASGMLMKCAHPVRL